MFVTPYKFPIVEDAIKVGTQLPLFFSEISMEQTKICFHQINQIFQKNYVRHSPNMCQTKVLNINKKVLLSRQSIRGNVVFEVISKQYN